MATTVNPNQCLNLDKGQQIEFIQFYQSLSTNSATLVRFFDRSDYFTVHGDEARFVGRSISKMESIKVMDPKGNDPNCRLDYLVLSKNSFPVAIRDLLLVKKYSVEVYVRESSRNHDWKIGYKGSPGNLIQFDDILNDNADLSLGSSLLSLQVTSGQQPNYLGMAFIDFFEQEIALIEFTDDENFSELEALIVLLRPSECLLPSKDCEYKRIGQILTRNNVAISLQKKLDNYNDSGVMEDLNRLLKFPAGQPRNAYTFIGPNKTEVSLRPLQAAIKYLELTTVQDFNGQFKIRALDLNCFVQMDFAALTALNIFPQSNIGRSKESNVQSLLGVLDRCKTAPGHRLMAQWVVQPLRSIDKINDRHNIVEYFVNSPNLRHYLHEDYLKRIPDILALSKKILRRKVTLQELYRLHQVVVRSNKMLIALQEVDNVSVHGELGLPLEDVLNVLRKFQEMVEQLLDLEALAKNEYLIRDSFDPDLRSLKERMTVIEDAMEDLLQKVANSFSLDSESILKLEYSQHLGYSFKVTRKHDHILRDKTVFQILDTTKSGVKFTNEKLTKLNEKYRSLMDEYSEKQQSIIDQVMESANEFVDYFGTLSGIIAKIDCLVSFAVCAISAPIPYVRPIMRDADQGRVLILNELRHPFVEVQENLNFIPNDVHFEEGKTQMYVITGPNMGGKSTYIRSVGCAVAMALMGAYVPCSRAEISLVDKIFGRVGACDDIGKGISTFMNEMVETASIVRNATKDSLVIIDELGRGTSTYEGCGLAWSIAEYLAYETKSFSLFATHFHEITTLAATDNAVKNYYMDAHTDDTSFVLLYQLKEGISEKSFGIHIANLVKFPPKTVSLATKAYQEIADPFCDMKDKEAKAIFDDISSALENVDKNGLSELIDSIRTKINNANNEYFNKAILDGFCE